VIATACATRGCKGIAPPRFTKCADCLLCTKKVDKIAAQIRAVAALPPMLVPPGSWKKQIAWSAKRTRPANWNMSGRYVVEIRSWFSTNASDVDGPVKMVLDALNGIAWFDDKQVAHAPPWKEVDPVAPRLEVLIRTEVGT